MKKLSINSTFLSLLIVLFIAWESLNKGYYFKEGVNELWPLPATAVNSNSAIVQNFGY